MDKIEAFTNLAIYLKDPLVLVGFLLLLFFGIHRTLIKSGIILPLSARAGSKILQILLRYGFLIAIAVIVLGFALAFFRTHRETLPYVDVNQIVTKLVSTHQKELGVYRKREETYQEEIKSLTNAVEALAKRREQPKERASIDDALKKLAMGDTGAAEKIFQEILESRVSKGKEAYKEAAEAARHLGALAFLHDTEKALSAYQRSVQLDPENAESWNRLGHLLERAGRLNEAEKAYCNVEALGITMDDSSLKAVAYGNMGNIYAIRGDLDRALEMYGKALAIDEELGRKEGMASAYGNIGIIYKTRGDLDRALEMYGKSLAIEKELGRKEGMASDYGNIGIIYKTRGDLDKAEEVWKRSLQLFEAIGAKDKIKLVRGLLADLREGRKEGS